MLVHNSKEKYTSEINKMLASVTLSQDREGKPRRLLEKKKTMHKLA